MKIRTRKKKAEENTIFTFKFNNIYLNLHINEFCSEVNPKYFKYHL